jgi:hypothetical protein
MPFSSQENGLDRLRFGTHRQERCSILWGMHPGKVNRLRSGDDDVS